jgi:hypothetical protein
LRVSTYRLRGSALIGQQSPMRLLFALLLWVIGAGIMVYGIGHALMELSSVYQGAISKPLDQPENVEKVFSQNMIRSLIIGAAGIPFLLIGTVMVRGALARKRRDSRLKRNLK